MSITSTTPSTAEHSAGTAGGSPATPPASTATGPPLDGHAGPALPMTAPAAQDPLPTAGDGHPRRRITDPQVSVVIPTFNEAKNLPLVLGRIPRDVHEVIIVDGHSVDDTVAVARFLRPDVKVVLQNRFGKGNAVACGFATVTGDVVVMLDADGSTDPGEIPRFVATLVGGADFAKGSRFADSGSGGVPPRGRGYRWLNRLANALFRTHYTDLCYGYHAIWRDCLSDLSLDAGTRDSGGRLWGDGFEIDTVINARAAKAGLRIAEVCSVEHAGARGRAGSPWRDGARVVRALLIERLNGVARAPRRAGQPREAPAIELPTPRGDGDTGAT